MKEATGELNMTVITVIAIAAVAALFYTLVWPAIQTAIVNNTCATYGADWHAVRIDASDGEEAAKLTGSNASKIKYACCPGTVTGKVTSECVGQETGATQ